MTTPQCRLLPFQVAEGTWNMAADETLLEAAAAGLASFRLYGWSQATLSLGYFQSSAVCRASPHLGQLPWVRRSTGGSALVHHHELTYALALPPGSPWQQRGESWLRRMHRIVADALASLGVSVRLCGDNEEKKLGDVLCFLHQTSGDLLLGEAKVAGSAQRKQRGVLLQHGSILLAASPHAPLLSGIRELSGEDLSVESLSAAITQQLKKQTVWQLDSGEWSARERIRIDQLIRDKYAHSAWNEKR
jgi:lipoate-protein ligase A